MRIAGIYSFNQGEEAVRTQFPELLREVELCISSIDAGSCKSKTSEEKTMTGQLLFSPVELNKQFKQQLEPLGWNSLRVPCQYPHTNALGV